MSYLLYLINGLVQHAFVFAVEMDFIPFVLLHFGGIRKWTWRRHFDSIYLVQSSPACLIAILVH